MWNILEELEWKGRHCMASATDVKFDALTLP